MLKDITIGQYFPGNSILHRLDPRTKLFLTLSFIVMLFVQHNPIPLLCAIPFVIIGYLLAGININLGLKSIKPVIPIIIFTAILNIFFTNGNIIWQYKSITITDRGILVAIMMITRIICLIVGSSLLTYTTSPIELTDAIERVFKPLTVFHFPAHELAMMMTIALRFIPTLIEETDKIMSAQKSRGANLDTGSLTEKAKALIPILVPLFISAFKRADELATAMECRCYHGGDGRTKMHELKYSGIDILGFLISIIFIVGSIIVNGYFIKVL